MNHLKKLLQKVSPKDKSEGIAEGKTQSRIEIAKAMIDKGSNEKEILEITGFTILEAKKYF